ncbi:diguanylate cyclase [Streptomyces sp. NPDC096205]|uniref:diguanylate cyclase n=1 Tax=Streptomyces sp. NPDC096205 TaxID=3366081 RepID=UPI0037F318A4
MSRDRAAEISRTGVTVDVGDATVRYLLYGLLPSWFVPGLADWLMHRRTRIEETTGTKESALHSLMMAEVGVPIALTLRYEVNPLLLTVQLAGAAAHEATALWDVRMATHSDREVRPIEQHIHSFLESLPFGALSALLCLHADQVKSLLRGGRGNRDAWRLVRRKPPLSRAYIAGIAAAVGTCVLLPYGEELLRCLRAARRENKRVTGDQAEWRATEGE